MTAVAFKLIHENVSCAIAAAAYHGAAAARDVTPGAIWMIAAHDRDVAGGLGAGCRAGFVARDKSYPALYPAPDVTADDMAGMAEALLVELRD